MSCPLIPGQKYDVSFYREETSATVCGLTFVDSLDGLYIFSEPCPGNETVSSGGVGPGERLRRFNRNWIQEIADHVAVIEEPGARPDRGSGSGQAVK